MLGVCLVLIILCRFVPAYNEQNHGYNKQNRSFNDQNQFFGGMFQ
jgi:hypothetical protein